MIGWQLSNPLIVSGSASLLGEQHVHAEFAFVLVVPRILAEAEHARHDVQSATWYLRAHQGDPRNSTAGCYQTSRLPLCATSYQLIVTVGNHPQITSW